MPSHHLCVRVKKRFRFFVAVVAVVSAALVAGSSHVAQAKPDFLGPFVERYPSATRLFSCGVCHYNFAGPGDDDDFHAGELSAPPPGASDGEGLNAYGKAFEEADGNDHPARTLATIENQDSDRDGTSNLEEISALNGFMPGYTCATYARAVNAAPNLAWFVDPQQVGCGLTTTTTIDVTTTSSTTTTTSTPVTSTTMPTMDECGSPLSGIDGPRVIDCLFILRVSLALETCSPECRCAPTGKLPPTATDALLCMKAAVGLDAQLACPCEPSMTTTTLPVTSTTFTTTSTTVTSTTMPATDVGRETYDTRCAGCHRAGAYDMSGFASDLKGDGNRLVEDLGLLDPAMSGLTLKPQELTDLAAFLDSL
jgi:hypothetical protein